MTPIASLSLWSARARPVRLSAARGRRTTGTVPDHDSAHRRLVRHRRTRSRRKSATRYSSSCMVASSTLPPLRPGRSCSTRAPISPRSRPCTACFEQTARAESDAARQPILPAPSPSSSQMSRTASGPMT